MAQGARLPVGRAGAVGGAAPRLRARGRDRGLRPAGILDRGGGGRDGGGARFAAGLGRLDGAPVDGRGLAARETAEAAARRIREGAFAAVSVERRTVRRRPAPPFTTAALQQEAARRFRFGVGYTMRIAQALYCC